MLERWWAKSFCNGSLCFIVVWISKAAVTLTFLFLAFPKLCAPSVQLHRCVFQWSPSAQDVGLYTWKTIEGKTQNLPFGAMRVCYSHSPSELHLPVATPLYVPLPRWCWAQPHALFGQWDTHRCDGGRGLINTCNWVRLVLQEPWDHWVMRKPRIQYHAAGKGFWVQSPSVPQRNAAAQVIQGMTCWRLTQRTHRIVTGKKWLGH